MRKDTFLAVQQHSKEALERHLEALLKLRDKIPSRSNTVRDASERSSAVGRGENARGAVIPLHIEIITDLSLL